MGICNATKFVWSALGVHPRELHTILHKVMKKDEKQQLRVDVDILPLYYKAKASMDHLKSMHFVIKKMLALAENGFHVKGIIDGFKRPDCKRASWERMAQSEMCAVNAFLTRQLAQSLSASLESASSDFERKSIAKEIKKLNAESVSNEKRVRISVPKDLKSQLEDLIFNYDGCHVGSYKEGSVDEDILQAEFQADSMMSKRLLNGETDLLFTVDSDVMGITGPDHFVVRNIDNAAKRKKGVEDLRCEIGGVGKALFEKIRAELPRESIEWKDISFPIFDTKSHKLRSYVAITLGCDVWTGIQGVGPAKCFKELKKYLYSEDKTDEEKEELFRNFMINEMKKNQDKNPLQKPDINDTEPLLFDEDLVNALSSAFMNEAVIDASSSPDTPYEYAHGKPETFPTFLSYYRKEDDETITIVDGPPTSECNGIPGVTPPHKYLQSEGTWSCDECGVSFCRTCGFVPTNLSSTMKKKACYKDKDKPLCMCCYKTASVGEIDGPPHSAAENIMKVTEMKKFLRKMNVRVQGYALPHEVEEIYDHYNENLPLYGSSGLSAEFPKFNSTFFNKIQKKVFYRGRLFSPDGFLSGNPNIKDKHVPAIVDLFANIVRHNPPGHSPYSTAAPAIIEDFSKKSRLTNGHAHKMIKSCLRHATDPRLPPITFEDFSFFDYTTKDGETVVGLVLDNEVPASMRSTMYKSKVAFTVEELLACYCTCLSSGTDTKDENNQVNDKVTCIHNMPLIFQACVELHTGQSINFLHDLAAAWTNNREAKLAEDSATYTKMKRNIVRLVAASNTPNISSIYLKSQDPSYSIRDMLTDFQVTTEKVKSFIHSPPLSHELIPFRCLPVESVTTRAKRGKRMKQEKDDDTSRISINTPGPVTNSSADGSKEPEAPTPTNATTTGPNTNNTSTRSDSSQRDNESASLSTVRLGQRLPFLAPTNDNSDHPSESDSDSDDDPTHPVDAVNPLMTDSYYCVAHQITKEEDMLIDRAGRSAVPLEVQMPSFQVLRDTYDNVTHATDLWLNDEVMNYYGELLSKEDERLFPNRRSIILNSHFMNILLDMTGGFDYKNVKSWSRHFPHKDIFQKLHGLICPINMSGNHWTGIAVDFSLKCIKYACSLGMCGKKYLDAMLNYLESYARDNNLPFDRSEWFRLDLTRHAPQQDNSYDCGIFVLINAYLTLHRIPLQYTQERVDVDRARRIIALSILKKRALTPITVPRPGHLMADERDNSGTIGGIYRNVDTESEDSDDDGNNDDFQRSKVAWAPTSACRIRKGAPQTSLALGADGGKLVSVRRKDPLVMSRNKKKVCVETVDSDDDDDDECLPKLIDRCDIEDSVSKVKKATPTSARRTKNKKKVCVETVDSDDSDSDSDSDDDSVPGLIDRHDIEDRATCVFLKVKKAMSLNKKKVCVETVDSDDSDSDSDSDDDDDDECLPKLIDRCDIKDSVLKVKKAPPPSARRTKNKKKVCVETVDSDDSDSDSDSDDDSVPGLVNRCDSDVEDSPRQRATSTSLPSTSVWMVKKAPPLSARRTKNKKKLCVETVDSDSDSDDDSVPGLVNRCDSDVEDSPRQRATSTSVSKVKKAPPPSARRTKKKKKLCVETVDSDVHDPAAGNTFMLSNAHVKQPHVKKSVEKDHSLEPKINEDLERLKLDIHKQSNQPQYDTFNPDYLRCFVLLNFLFGTKKYPSDKVGFELVRMRKEKQERESKLTPWELKNYISTKRGTLCLDWKKVVEDLGRDKSKATNNVKINKNRRVVKTNKLKTVIKRKRDSYSKKTKRNCCFHNCRVTSTNSKCSFERIPKPPKPVDDKDLIKKRPRDIGRYLKRKIISDLAHHRCNVKHHPKADFRICSRHKKEFVTVTKCVQRRSKLDLMFKFTFCVPKTEKAEEASIGVMPKDRMVVKTLKDVPYDNARALTMFAMVAMDTIEILRNGNKSKGRLSQAVMNMLDIEDEAIEDKLKISSSMMADGARRKSHRTKKKEPIRSFDMDDAEVKMRTGFESKDLMLGFIAIVSNGDLFKIIKTKYSTYTWFEEWFLYFEFLWGRTWLNQRDLTREYAMNAQRKNELIDTKLRLVLACRESWPKFCTHDEDLALRGAKWDGILDSSSRIIQHDTTGIMMSFKPSLSASQRITWNNYYHGNVAKGNIFLQCGGWMGTDPLWVGGISDSQYMVNNDIFEQQHEFAVNDTAGNNEDDTPRPFVNILDRGYQLHLQAFRNGRQTVIQPVFEQSGRRFTGSETLYSASTSSIRSGNERAVRKSKISGFIRKGLRPKESPRRFDDVWLAWSFQMNFMYKPNA